MTDMTALITGASRGIGRAIALELAGPGMRLALIYRGNQHAAEETAAACREMGAQEGSLDEALARARALQPAGLCAVDGSRVHVPDSARLFLRTVAQCFDAHTPAAPEQRHAKAV